MLEGDVDLTLVPRESLFASLLATVRRCFRGGAPAAVEKHGISVTVNS